MEISVSDSNLRAVLSRFRSVPGAQVEFVLSSDSLDIVANAEGYRSLARWCLVMAHPEMEDHADPEWLHAAYHLDDVIDDESRVSVTFRSPASTVPLESHDVRFHRSEKTGPAFWQSGNDGAAAPT